MKPLRIVLAEDNDADVFLVRQALEEHRVAHELHVVKDGDEAIRFLGAMGGSVEEPSLDLLLLDLNLPKVDGVEVLRDFRQHDRFARTPVVIISSSSAQREHARLSGLQVSRYFQKPLDLDEFMRLGGVVKEVTGRPE